MSTIVNPLFYDKSGTSGNELNVANGNSDSQDSFRRAVAVISLILTVIGLAFMIAWVINQNRTLGYLGGINFHDRIFAYHALFMYLGLFVATTWAILSFRIIKLFKIG